MKTREVMRVQWYKVCPICAKEIKGASEVHVDYNMQLHLEKHEKEQKKK